MDSEAVEIYNPGNVQSFFIEGLDGVGKETATEEIAKEAAFFGKNVLIVSFPQYGYQLGERIKQELRSNSDLNIHERMALFVLDRMAAIDSIKESVAELQKNGKKVTVIYDRSPMSNVLTLAYYFLENKIPINENIVLGFYSFMLFYDRVFNQELGLDNANTYILRVGIKDALNAISNDTTRNIVDKHEQPDVQEIADKMYQIIAKNYPERVHVIDQMVDGRRMTPTEIRDNILRIQSPITKIERDEGEISHLRLKPGHRISSPIREAMIKLAKDIDSERILQVIADCFPDQV